MIGAGQLGDLGAEFEDACRARQIATAQEKLDRLLAELQTVCNSLSSLRETS